MNLVDRARRVRGIRPPLVTSLGLALLVACSGGEPVARTPAIRRIPCTVRPAVDVALLRAEFGPAHPAGSFVDRARWLGDGRLHLERSTSERSQYKLVLEFWVRFRPPEPPRVEMSSCVYSWDSSFSSPHTDLEGRVVVNSSGDELESPSGPGRFILAYDVTGPCSGSPVDRRGVLVVDASDIEGG